jgi:hypothetical protein
MSRGLTIRVDSVGDGDNDQDDELFNTKNNSLASVKNEAEPTGKPVSVIDKAPKRHKS